MDTTYVSIMLVVFLVVTGLAVDVGYLYVSEEELRDAAESAALTGADAVRQRLLLQMQRDPKGIPALSGDTVQPSAREAAAGEATGKHAAAARVELKDNRTNALSDSNDITVGFWNLSSHSYTPGGTPVNAMQVRTRRTAESSTVGMGGVGAFLAKISGTESFASTPEAVAALVPATRANLSLCSDSSPPDCSYPTVCNLPDRRFSADGAGDGSTGHFLFTSLLHPVTAVSPMSETACREMPPQEVCGRPIYTAAGDEAMLRDLKAMMYDPKVDRPNKEYDRKGRVTGWWVILPVTDCGAVKPGNVFETRIVTRYALVRISRICADGPRGCQQTAAGSPVPEPTTGACAAGRSGVYLDRITSVGCGSRDAFRLPGLKPILVKSHEGE